jgi:hypothetical protein
LLECARAPTKGTDVKRAHSKLICLLALGAAAGGCTKQTDGSSEQKTEVGTLTMALETTSNAGNRFRLRQAVFLIDRANQFFDDGFEDEDGFGDLDDGTETTFQRVMSIDSEDNPLAPDIRKELVEGSYRAFLTNGWFLERVDPDLGIVRVDATLRGSSTKEFSIFSQNDTQLSFTFETNGEIINFGPGGNLVITPVVIEDDGTDPPDPVDFGLVMENQRSAMPWSLREAMGSLAENAGLVGDADFTYQSLIDTYASADQGRLGEASHCGDETVDGAPTLNGYPIDCNRAEHQQFDNLDSWFPIAAMNRLDLAPLDGSHCGQQRLVFANNEPVGNGRMFVILEAQIPNPNPECGVEACRPIAEAWSLLDQFEFDPFTRGEILRQMFLTGDPTLLEQGFGPFMSAANLTVGSGQVRTNNFNGDIWTLREFKVVTGPDASRAMVLPFPTSESPFGALWDDTSALPQGEACRENFLTALDGLLTDNPARMAFVVDDACKNAESRNDFFTEQYAFHLFNGTGEFADRINERVQDFGLSAGDIANRAQFAGSCIGCHSEAVGLDLGNGVQAPFSFDFTHFSEFFFDVCADGSEDCTPVSESLSQVFLPHRLEVTNTLLESFGCGFTDDDVSDDDFTDEDFGGDGDGSDMGDGDGDGDNDGSGDGDGDSAPVPAIRTAVFTEDTTLQDLVDAEEAARESYEDETTLGGQPAGLTH